MIYQREYDRYLKVGMVGLGNHAYRNLMSSLHHLLVRLAALCDMNLGLAHRTGAECRGDV